MKIKLALEETKEFWNVFYSKNINLDVPSPFAIWFSNNYLSPQSKILELGCGNGRDSFYFDSKGFSCSGIDSSYNAIESNNLINQSKNLTFTHFDVSNLNSKEFENLKINFNVVYSRFFLHAVPQIIENQILNFCNDKLKQGDIFAHEFRTTNDPLFLLGESIGNNEKYTDHYRRFIDYQKFLKKIDLDFWEILFCEESNGFAPFNDQDPVVCRIVARKIK